MASCFCGLGKDCIIQKRKRKDWVQEDLVFTLYELPLRRECSEEYGESRERVIYHSMALQYPGKELVYKDYSFIENNNDVK